MDCLLILPTVHEPLNYRKKIFADRHKIVKFTKVFYYRKKIFADRHKIVKFTKVFSLESFSLAVQLNS